MNGLSNATPINYSYWTWTRQHKTEKLSETVLQDVSKKNKKTDAIHIQSSSTSGKQQVGPCCGVNRYTVNYASDKYGEDKNKNKNPAKKKKNSHAFC